MNQFFFKMKFLLLTTWLRYDFTYRTNIGNQAAPGGQLGLAQDGVNQTSVVEWSAPANGAVNGELILPSLSLPSVQAGLADIGIGMSATLEHVQSSPVEGIGRLLHHAEVADFRRVFEPPKHTLLYVSDFSAW